MKFAKVASALGLVCAFTGLVPKQAHALSTAELLIFDALNVQAIRLGDTAVAQKSVGGLVCERYEDINSPTASCSLGEADRNDEAIYDALNVTPENVTPSGLQDYVIYEKSIGGLICTRSHAIGLNPVRPYSSCRLN